MGGLIGLCMGFSLLSLFEIFYWFTNRMYNDWRVEKEKKRSGGNDSGF